jgi:hypothetical protein
LTAAVVQPAPPFGAEEGKYPSFACASESASAGGTEAGEGLEQGLGAGGVIKILAGAGAHAGNYGGGVGHLAVGEDANLLSGGANEFDGADGALGVVRNVDDHYFGARILKLSEDGVGRSGGKPDVTEHRLSQARRFQTTLQSG